MNTERAEANAKKLQVKLDALRVNAPRKYAERTIIIAVRQACDVLEIPTQDRNRIKFAMIDAFRAQVKHG